MRETDLVKLVLDWLKLHKIFAWRSNTGAMAGSHKGKRWFVRFGYPGIADILCCVNGRLVAIECKVGRNDQSEAQKQFQAELEKAGGQYILCRHIDEVVEAMK